MLPVEPQTKLLPTRLGLLRHAAPFIGISLCTMVISVALAVPVSAAPVTLEHFWLAPEWGEETISKTEDHVSNGSFQPLDLKHSSTPATTTQGVTGQATAVYQRAARNNSPTTFGSTAEIRINDFRGAPIRFLESTGDFITGATYRGPGDTLELQISNTKLEISGGFDPIRSRIGFFLTAYELTNPTIASGIITNIGPTEQVFEGVYEAQLSSAGVKIDQGGWETALPEPLAQLGRFSRTWDMGVVPISVDFVNFGLTGGETVLLKYEWLANVDNPSGHGLGRASFFDPLGSGGVSITSGLEPLLISTTGGIPAPAPVPEPGTFLLLGSGLLGLGLFKFRNFQRG